MAAPLITAITTVPNRENATNQASFSNDADTFFSQVDDFQNEANAQAQYLDGVAAEVDASEAAAAASALESAGYASTALDARDAAISSAAYKGPWEGKTSAGVIGESYSYQGSYIYRLNVNLANISTSVPSPTNTDWQLINVVPFEAPCKPTLDLDFANQDFTIYDKLGGFVKRPLADIVSQGRATAGTSTDAIGGVTEFTAGENRFTFDGETGEALGYLSEESRTNLLTNSEDFANSAWVKINSAVSQVDDYFIFSENTSTSFHALLQSKSYISGSFYTIKVLAKYHGRHLQITGGAGEFGSVFVNFDMINGVVGSSNLLSGTIEKIGDYYLCTATGVAVSTATGGGLYLTLVQSPSSPRAQSYRGDGESGVKIKYAQLEVGSFPTSYIRTLGAPVTRAADSMTRTLGQEWNTNEGTFVVEFELASSTTQFILNSGGERWLYLSGSSVRFSDGTNINLTNLNQTVVNTVHRVSVSATKTQSFISANGFETSVAVCDGSPLLINALNVCENVGSVKISRITYYPRAFDALTLQRLSRIQ